MKLHDGTRLRARKFCWHRFGFGESVYPLCRRLRRKWSNVLKSGASSLERSERMNTAKNFQTLGNVVRFTLSDCLLELPGTLIELLYRTALSGCLLGKLHPVAFWASFIECICSNTQGSRRFENWTNCKKVWRATRTKWWIMRNKANLFKRCKGRWNRKREIGWGRHCEATIDMHKIQSGMQTGRKTGVLTGIQTYWHTNRVIQRMLSILSTLQLKAWSSFEGSTIIEGATWNHLLVSAVDANRRALSHRKVNRTAKFALVRIQIDQWVVLPLSRSCSKSVYGLNFKILKANVFLTE